MKLIDVITALGIGNINPKVDVTILDNSDVPLITYGSGGYASVDATLSNRVVKQIKVNSATLITVAISDDTEP